MRLCLPGSPSSTIPHLAAAAFIWGRRAGCFRVGVVREGLADGSPFTSLLSDPRARVTVLFTNNKTNFSSIMIYKPWVTVVSGIMDVYGRED
uniref:Uncharacterized protein n=1 Tax=Oryza punctata TaxID=4537 RepID=A0A0E0K8G9_ORYPU